MERIIGDAVSGARWASETFSDHDPWSRIVTVIKECLEIDDWILEDQQDRLKWIVDSLPVTFELVKTKPFPQLRMTIEVFCNFESDSDGWYLASNLNRKAVGGVYVYQHVEKRMDFVSYCALSIWWDFALLIVSGKTAIGQCEIISRRQDVLRFNKCQQVRRIHPTLGQKTKPHRLFVERLTDKFSVDFVGGLWISETERSRILKFIADECQNIEIEPEWLEGGIERSINKLDFRFQVFADENYISVFNNNSAIAAIAFNEWTDFGRAIAIDIGLPFFTHSGIFDDGASHERAVWMANLLNEGAIKTLWEKVGFGAFHVKGSQIVYSKVITHVAIKPVVLRSLHFEIADILFDLINPNLISRIVKATARELESVGEKTMREPDSMDLMDSIKRSRRKVEPVRVASETIENIDTLSSYWDMPSKVIFLYGVYQGGPVLGSIEIVEMPNRTILIDRWRALYNPGELVLADLDDLDRKDLLIAIEDAIAGLHEGMVEADFFHIPPDVVEDTSNAILRGLLRLANHYGERGFDLMTRAFGIRKYPNPWWRPSDEELKNTGIDLAEFPELQSADPNEAYLFSALDLRHVDCSLGFFQSWLEGAIVMRDNPESTDEAARKVEAFAKHTLDRIGGSAS
jgi:hypothetical protein